MIASILIIEDDNADSELMLLSVQAQCERIKRVRTLEAGLDQIKLQPWDVIMLDVGLPDSRDAQHAIASVKSAKPIESAIVVVSGNDNPDEMRAGILANADGWVVKGKWGALLHEVRAAYEHHRHCVRIAAISDSIKKQGGVPRSGEGGEGRGERA